MIEKKHAPSESRRGLPLRSSFVAVAVGLVLAMLGASWAVAETTGLLGQRVQQATFASSSGVSSHGSKRIARSGLRLGYRRSVTNSSGRYRSPADTTAPQTTISTQPTSPTTATTARISFTASEGRSSFACKLDAGRWAACTAPKSYRSLALGTHTFSVRATDAAGNLDATPATASWNVQTSAAPAPPAETPPAEPVPPAETPPTDPTPPAEPETPADTAAPNTTISTQPTSPTTSTSASIPFTASESGSTFACKLDAGSWASCTSPKSYSSLSVGTHTFSVRATDAAGNVDATPASTSWSVQAPTSPPPPADTAAPNTTISTQPTSPTTSTSASIPFTASESGSIFACKLDAGSWASCTSPKSYSSLSVGTHTFSVRATDAAGNVDATPATASWSVEAPAPPPPPATGTHCFSSPSGCGYPDETNTGVPAGKTLTNSGSMTLSTNGQVVDSKNITGSVTVTADNVTIRNSKLHTTEGGSGARVITLNSGADNFTIEDSEVYGNGSTTNAPESAVWNHYNNPGARMIRSYVHGSADNWEGRVDLVKDSYMVVDGAYSGSHDENIYVCSTTVNVDHSTLFNENGQTATVFGDTICGGGNTFTVTNSLLAGGGFVFYPQANNSNPAGAKTVITGNRIARCATKAVYNSSSGGSSCQGGADASGFYPLGGYYGVGAYFSGTTTWSENVWDDTLAPIAKP